MPDSQDGGVGFPRQRCLIPKTEVLDSQDGGAGFPRRRCRIPKTEVPDLGSGGIRLNLTPDGTIVHFIFLPVFMVNAVSHKQ